MPSDAVAIGRPTVNRSGLIGASAIALVAVLFAVTATPWFFRRIEWPAVMPTFALRWQMASGDAAAARELSRRQAYGSLWFGQLAASARSALAAQSDPRIPWTREMGDLVEAARIAGDLSDEDWRRYARHAPQPYLKVRPTVRAGDRVPIEFWLGPSRIDGSESQIADGRGRVRFDAPSDAGWPKEERWFYLYHKAISVRVGDGPAQPIEDDTVRYSGRAPLPPGGANHQWTNDWPVGFTVPPDAPAGATIAAIEYELRVEQIDNRPTRERNASPLPEPVLASWRQTFGMPITIVPKAAETVEGVQEPSIDAAVRAAIELLPEETRAGGKPIVAIVSPPSSEIFEGGVRVKRPPVPVAFEVLIRTGDGRTVKAGAIASAGGRAVGFGLHQSLLWGTTGDTVDVILRPSAEVARATASITQYWNGGDIVFRDVPIYWSLQPGKPTAGRPVEQAP